MKISLNWLKTLVQVPWAPEKMAEILTELGFPVDAVTATGVSVEHVVSAKILDVQKHPNADRLSVTKVTDGKTEMTVVCGAPNVATGQVVPLALPGTKFPNGIEITVTRIRGVESYGMLCSERELGISENHAGIMQLPLETPLGVEVSGLLGGSDVIFDVDVTPNRPDALSHIGIARELAAFSNGEIALQKSNWKKGKGPDQCKIEIEAPALCHRYLGKIFYGVQIGPSPKWIAQRLTSCGIRPINNIVDITNYVLLEWGHPLHAFDLEILRGKMIIVRKARPEESIKALDEKIYSLTQDDLVIADNTGPVAIAGIMGGEHSGVTDKTTAILLESAVFDPKTVRKTSRRLGLKSQSSIRFEKGSDAGTAALASLRAADLIMELAGGTPGDATDAFPRKTKPMTLTLTAKTMECFVGAELPKKDAEKILKALDFRPKKTTSGWSIQVPHYRKDIIEECDLVEEVIRHYGYNRLPARSPTISLGNVAKELLPLDTKPLRQTLMGWGITEVITSSFCAPEWASAFVSDKNKFSSLENPLSQEEGILRPHLLGNLLKAVQKNSYNQQKSIQFFEIGKEFIKTDSGGIQENHRLAIVLYGLHSSASVHQKEKPVNYFDLKGLVEGLAERFELKLNYTGDPVPDYLHPHQSIVVNFQRKTAGYLGIIHPELAQKLDLTLPCGVVELDISLFEPKKAAYHSFSRFPHVERDMAIVVDKNTSWQQVEEAVREKSGVLLTMVHPFDIFESEAIGVGKKSLAFRMTFQHLDKTLTDQEINSLVDSVRQTLKSRCGADVR